ncbi:tetratricopeptide repeat-containing sulfotransferase family protein [uncultured Roseibium sp.]|uniref:tetratricopeptide repeat-containing sulfotransferase family protein n=1 Tax=uncultured Roseibium sp. TaxID=1936171 RepID=UPI002604E3AB|nr:tetratricopeptide repeat-containing sulfotransferase family protein [uncultured Roseibium sp.]
MNPGVTQLVQEALSHQHAGRIPIALDLFEQVLRLDPRNPQANFSLGIAAYQEGNIGLAIERLQIAARKAGKHPQVHQLLGIALMNAGDVDGAQASLKKAVSLAPKEADFHAQLGDLYRIKRQAVMSRQSYLRALKLDPENGYGLVGMGQLEITVGNIDEAIEWFEKAIDCKKEMPTAFQCLSLARSFKEKPAELDQIEALIGDGSPRPGPDQANLHWAAGKIYHDIGDTSRGLEHYQEARKLHYPPFDPGAYEDRIAFTKEVFNEDFFANHTDVADTSEKPVFIFGLPRSGTTLIEQIVSCHSQAASGGEIQFFRHLQEEMGLKGQPSAALENRLKNIDPKEFRRIARKYLAILDGIDRRADRVTDKMPHNYEMVWLMSLLFPKATFIHCSRSAADTCISLLSHPLSPAHNYALTQDTVGRYYRTYASLMDHWQKVVPVDIHTLAYEALVDDQRAESETLLSHAGLSWEDACLEFYKSESPVTTFSNTQVRRPIFRSSLGRWQGKETHYQDLFAALGPFAPQA